MPLSLTPNHTPAVDPPASKITPSIGLDANLTTQRNTASSSGTKPDPLSVVDILVSPALNDLVTILLSSPSINPSSSELNSEVVGLGTAS